jgi:hypothetical protein
MRKRKKYQIFVLFLEVVTLTFVLQTSLSIGFLLIKLGTHMPDGERQKPIDNEVCRTKVKVTTSKNRTKI